MNQKLLIQNVHLQALAEQVISHKAYFGEVTFTHICKQKNKQVDTLYKQALQLDTNSLWLEEYKNGVTSVILLRI